MKNRRLIAVGTAVVVGCVFLIFLIWHQLRYLNEVEHRPPENVMAVSDVDRDVVDVAKQFRTQVEEHFKDIKWFEYDLTWPKDYYSRCLLNDFEGSTFSRDLAHAEGLTVTDYPAIQQMVIDLTAQYGWTEVIDTEDAYSLRTYIYHPDDLGWFYLSRNEGTGITNLVFFGACYHDDLPPPRPKANTP